MFENLQNEKNTPNPLARYNTPKCVATLNFIGVGLMNTQLVEKQTYFGETLSVFFLFFLLMAVSPAAKYLIFK